MSRRKQPHPSLANGIEDGTPCEPMTPKAHSLHRRVRRHRKFWMETPAGNDVHILGDPRMPAATKRALGEMMDAAVKAYNDGKLTMPPNDQAHRSAPGGTVERNQEKQNE